MAPRRSPPPSLRRPSNKSPLRLLLAVLPLAALALLGAERVRRDAWTTMDEPFHLQAARELKSGRGVVSNFEHPVGIKLLASWAMEPSTRARLVEETRDGRRPFPAVFALLVLTAGLWAAWRAGPLAGVLAAGLLTLDPTFRAHGALVQSDVPLCLFLVLAAALLDLSRTRPRLLVACGASFGLAMALKYSAAPFLLPFLAVAFAALRRTGPPAAVARRLGVSLVVPALVTLFAVQQLAAGATARGEMTAAVDRQAQEWGMEAQRPRLARTVQLLPRGAAAYAAGLSFVRAAAEPGVRFNYFLGHVSGKGSPLYFPVALAVKLETAAVLGLVALAAALTLALARAATRRRERLLALLSARAALPASLALLYLAAGAVSDLNIGVRHALPVAALGFVAASGAAATLLRRRGPRMRFAVAAVLSLCALEAALSFGREIPFGNWLAGGNRGMRRLLSDSNVDWGEAQGRLFARVRRGDLGRVGVVSVPLDEAEALRAGVAARPEAPDPTLDSVFVSVHVFDLGQAFRRGVEDTPKQRWLSGWLLPFLDDLERRKVSVEPFGDEYLLYRLSRPAPRR